MQKIWNDLVRQNPERVWNLSTCVSISGSHGGSNDYEKVVEELWELRGRGYEIRRHRYKLLGYDRYRNRLVEYYNIPKETFQNLEDFKKVVLGVEQFQCTLLGGKLKGKVNYSPLPLDGGE